MAPSSPLSLPACTSHPRPQGPPPQLRAPTPAFQWLLPPSDRLSSPSSSSSAEMALPMPVPPPVTMATRLRNSPAANTRPPLHDTTAILELVLPVVRRSQPSTVPQGPHKPRDRSIRLQPCLLRLPRENLQRWAEAAVSALHTPSQSEEARHPNGLQKRIVPSPPIGSEEGASRACIIPPPGRPHQFPPFLCVAFRAVNACTT